MSQCQMSGRDQPVRRSSCTSLELDTRQTVNIAGPGTVSRCHFLTLLSPYYHFLTLLSHRSVPVLTCHYNEAPLMSLNTLKLLLTSDQTPQTYQKKEQSCHEFPSLITDCATENLQGLMEPSMSVSVSGSLRGF